jgi:hypothetical protein
VALSLTGTDVTTYARDMTLTPFFRIASPLVVLGFALAACSDPESGSSPAGNGPESGSSAEVSCEQACSHVENQCPQFPDCRANCGQLPSAVRSCLASANGCDGAVACVKRDSSGGSSSGSNGGSSSPSNPSNPSNPSQASGGTVTIEAKLAWNGDAIRGEKNEGGKTISSTSRSGASAATVRGLSSGRPDIGGNYPASAIVSPKTNCKGSVFLSLGNDGRLQYAFGGQDTLPAVDCADLVSQVTSRGAEILLSDIELVNGASGRRTVKITLKP